MSRAAMPEVRVVEQGMPTLQTPVKGPALVKESVPAAEAPEFTPAVRTVIISLLIFGVVLLASIWGWLWYGMHLYQNIS
jgi:hypothetical protein